MQAQGGPSRAELWDKGQQGTPDSHLWLKTPVHTSCRPPKAKQKAIPMPFRVRKHFPFEIKIWLDLRFFSPFFVVAGGRGGGGGEVGGVGVENEVIETEKEAGEEANFWNVHVKKKRKKKKKRGTKNIQSIPPHTEHANVLRS